MSPAESGTRLQAIVSGFAARRVLVLADAILEEYLTGDCSRISPEAPVPVVRVRGARRVLGGAANTAANLAALGARPTLVSLVGDDDAGATLERCSEARRKGDVLFVGLMSGSPERDRTELLLGLRAVDYVHILERPDATGFLEVLKPDVHLSADWVGTASIERT